MNGASRRDSEGSEDSAASPALPAESSDQNMKVVPVILAIALAAVLIVFLAGTRQGREFVKENLWVVVNIFFGGVLASAVTALLLHKYVGQVWQSDLSKQTRALNHVGTSVTQMTTEVRRDREQLLKNLPSTLGGTFVRSLLSYHPETSARIAEIISLQTRDLYEHHYQRVMVTHAEDTYRLESVEDVEVGGHSFKVWRLKFHAKWTWFNDSRVTKYPLNDFRILVAAPDLAINNFLSGMSSADQSEAVDRRQRFDDKEKNYVKSTVVHPRQPNWRLMDPGLSTMFQFGSINFRMQSERSNPYEEQDLVRHEPAPVGIYKIYSVPLDDQRAINRDTALLHGQEMEVSYQGEIAFALYGDPPRGKLEFAPSDIIGDSYALNLIVPRPFTIDREPVVILTDRESGCYRLHRKLDQSDLRRLMETYPLPGGFDVGEFEHYQMKVGGNGGTPLFDYHQIRAAWRVGPVPTLHEGEPSA